MASGLLGVAELGGEGSSDGDHRSVDTLILRHEPDLECSAQAPGVDDNTVGGPVARHDFVRLALWPAAIRASRDGAPGLYLIHASRLGHKVAKVQFSFVDNTM